MNLQRIFYLIFVSAALQVCVAKTTNAQQVTVTLTNQAHDWIAIVDPGPLRKVLAAKLAPHDSKTVNVRKGAKLKIWLGNKLLKTITINKAGVQTIKSHLPPPPKTIPKGTFNVSGEWSRGKTPNFNPANRADTCTINMDNHGLVVIELDGRRFGLRRSDQNPNTYQLKWESGPGGSGQTAVAAGRANVVFSSETDGIAITRSGQTSYYKRPKKNVPSQLIFLPGITPPPTHTTVIVQPVAPQPIPVVVTTGTPKPGAARPAGQAAPTGTYTRGTPQPETIGSNKNPVLKTTGTYFAGVSKAINFTLPAGKRTNVAFEATVYLEDNARAKSAMVTFDGILVRSTGAPLVPGLAVIVVPGTDGSKLAVRPGGNNTLRITLNTPSGSGNYVASVRLTQD